MDLSLLSTTVVITRLNQFRRKLDIATIKGTSLSRLKLEEMALGAARRCADLNYPPAIDFLKTKGPTVVAEGAYRSSEEAIAKTGHTTAGKTQTQLKYERAKEKLVNAKVINIADAKKPTPVATKKEEVAKATTPPAATKKKAAAAKKTPGKAETPKGQITLADIARSINTTPEKARNHARRNAKEIAALQVSKTTKYVFPIANKAKVVKLISKE